LKKFRKICLNGCYKTGKVFMRKKYLLFAIFGLIFGFPQFAMAQPGTDTSTAPGSPVLNSRDLSAGALSTMDAALAPDEEFTPIDEYYLGRAVAANILTVYRLYTQNPELTRYLNLICQTIVINSPRSGLYNGYHVGILDSPEYNAFASPGGHIFITRGLVEAASSEDMLAAIIAHEIAHIILRHGIGTVDDMRLSNTLASIADWAFETASPANPTAARVASIRNSVNQITDTMMKYGYSRPQEFEADNEAITLLAASGYNPNALVEMLRILQQSQASQRGGFAVTHPSPAERIANAENTSRRYRAQDSGSYRVQRFRNIR
jgi:predicted Zn-dependent protease